jgi:uncharacterized DUF497 family protein
LSLSHYLPSFGLEDERFRKSDPAMKVHVAYRLRLGSRKGGEQYRQARRPREAMGVLQDPLARSLPDFIAGEERWVTLGLATTGKLTVVVHTWVESGADGVAVRIISARRATRRESRQYREGDTS